VAFDNDQETNDAQPGFPLFRMKKIQEFSSPILEFSRYFWSVCNRTSNTFGQQLNATNVSGLDESTGYLLHKIGCKYAWHFAFLHACNIC